MLIAASELQVKFAQSVQEREAAQRLRYQVFVTELGATGRCANHQDALEQDAFDPFCDHLLLIDPKRRSTCENGGIVGTYRLMRMDQATAAGGFYSACEYDLSPLIASGKSLLELGRSCLLPAYRGTDAMWHMWRGVAEYAERHAIEVLFGVASLPGTDIAALAEPLSLLHHRHLAPEHYRARARAPGYRRMDILDPQDLDRRAAVLALPALVKAYLRLGGAVGEGAYVDPDFNCTDVYMVLAADAMKARQSRIYAGALS